MRTLLKLSAPLLMILSTVSCCHKKEKTQPDEESVLAVLYQQKSAEYEALCLQSYNLARQQVNQALSQKHALPLAVVTDLDETALDNSGSEVDLYKKDTTATPASLRAWWLAGKAGAVPGAVEFFNWVKSKGVNIYYVSNRTSDDSVVNATRKNMQALHFPFTSEQDNDHFRFKTNASSKEPRRLEIAKTNTIVVLLGDNLSDVDMAFDGKANDERDSAVYKLKQNWGNRYIVFPNAIYGDWEAAFYLKFKADNPKRVINQKLKDSIRRTFLKPSN